MASQQTNQTQNGIFSILLPVVMGFATAAPSQDRTERFVLINPFGGSVMVIQGFGDSNKEGPLPASKAAIEALPVVRVEEEGLECAICLGEYEEEEKAKEMPCKHRFHSGCIDKWLRIHGSCPVCRYKLPPVEEEYNEGGDVSSGGENRGGEGEVQISLFFGGGGGYDDDDDDDTRIL